MTAITITATRRSGGWEPRHGDERWTQVATLDRAGQQVRDDLDTVEPDVDHDTWVIDIVPEIGPLGAEVAGARRATAEAAAATRVAARRARAGPPSARGRPLGHRLGCDPRRLHRPGVPARQWLTSAIVRPALHDLEACTTPGVNGDR